MRRRSLVSVGSSVLNIVERYKVCRLPCRHRNPLSPRDPCIGPQQYRLEHIIMRVVTALALLAAALATSTYAGTCHQMRTLIASKHFAARLITGYRSY